MPRWPRRCALQSRSGLFHRPGRRRGHGRRPQMVQPCRRARRGSRQELAQPAGRRNDHRPDRGSAEAGARVVS